MEEGKRRLLLWKIILNEARLDWTDVERLVNDGKDWRRIVEERMKHLHVWECQEGYEYSWRRGEDRVEQNVRRVAGFVRRYEGCANLKRV